MKPETNTNGNIALFVDIENLISNAAEIGLPIDLSVVIARLKEEGKIIIRRSFGDLKKALQSNNQLLMENEIRRMLYQNLVQHEDIPYITAKKNTADIRLVVEALAIAYTHPDLSHFAILASDRDYVPLFNKLHELGRTVISIAIDEDSSNSPMLRESADLLVYYDSLLGETAAPAEAKPTDTNFSPLEEEYLQLLQKAIRATGEGVRPVSAVVVREKMRQLRADFSPALVGLASFSDFLARAQTARIVKVHSSDTDRDYLLELGDRLLSKATAKPAVSVGKASGAVTAKDLFQFIQDKLKLPLPDYETRANILESAFESYDHLIQSGPFTIDEWKEATLKFLKNRKHHGVSEQAVFKTLHSLKLARGALSLDFNDRNLIVGLKIEHEQAETVIVSNFISQIENERGWTDLPDDVLLEVFYPKQPDGAKRLQRARDRLV